MSEETKATHTPGPWDLSYQLDDRLARIESGDSRIIATVPFKRAELDDEGVANARLIASAPDLLAALDELVDATVDAYNSCRIPAAPWLIARSAIAKARGES